MRLFLAACITAILIAIIGMAALTSIQEPVTKAYTTSAVNLGA